MVDKISVSTPAVTDRPARRRESWWGQYRRGQGVCAPYDRATEILAVLQHARDVVEAGWVQNRWTARSRPLATATLGDGRPSGPGGGTTTDATTAACVVGAVALAVRARDPRADLAVATGPALAFVWDAVHGDSRFRAAGRAAPHDVRIARMRELARWNDQPGRTRDEVVDALDRAAAQVVAHTVEPARAR